MVFVVFERQLRLGDLLLERALIAAEVEVAHQLHRDRRRPLKRFAVHEILDGGAEDPGGVDAVVLVEALVLDRNRGVGEVGGDLRPGDRRAQLVGLDEPEARAVGGEHLRGGAVDDRVAPGEARRGVGDRDHVRHRADGAEEQRARQHDQDDEEDAGGPPVVAAALACESGHAKGALKAACGGYRPDL